ncbi:unnamed protein product [Brachionus calyciflorus]|uniref:G-protein coupled receptors family 1 profile domain-containing protein n=1 Tax=Brachionus calyciflorus TaxID=104777 RepID=A0A814A8R4_9BILA|nr:unnamed protein product [Brachionus calyciflorus]
MSLSPEEYTTEVIFTFIVPVICFYGCVSNIINAIVFSNRKLRTNITFNYMFIISCAYVCLFLSILYGVPFAFGLEKESLNGTNTTQEIYYTVEYKIPSMINMITSIFRNIILVVIMFAINVTSLICFRRSVKKKKMLKISKKTDDTKSKETKASTNLTRMVIILGFVNFCGSIPNMMYYVFVSVFGATPFMYRYIEKHCLRF